MLTYTVKRKDQTIQIHTYNLTFNKQLPPKIVNAGYQIVSVEKKFIPQSLRCNIIVNDMVTIVSNVESKHPWRRTHIRRLPKSYN